MSNMGYTKRTSKVVYAWLPKRTINKGWIWLQYVLKVTAYPPEETGIGKVIYYRG